MVNQYILHIWWNNEIIIGCNGDMVKLSNGEYFFRTHFHQWRNGEMVKKINNTMNCMVRFNCCMGYQLCFSLLGFLQARQWWPYWQLWGSSTMLSMVSAGIPSILSCHLSVFSDGWSGVMVRWFMMVQRLWWDIFVAAILPSAICYQQLLEWFFSPALCSGWYFPGYSGQLLGRIFFQ